jgi:hypothetical protein
LGFDKITAEQATFRQLSIKLANEVIQNRFIDTSPAEMARMLGDLFTPGANPNNFLALPVVLASASPNLPPDWASGMVVTILYIVVMPLTSLF